MQDQKNSKLGWGTQVSVAAVYGIFFIVQIFFNLCINQATNPKTVFSPSGKLKSSQTCLIQKSDGNKQFSNTIRLNKRFQPATSPVALNEVEPPLITFSEIVKLQKPLDYLLFSVVLAKSLRGPPCVIA